MCVPRGQQEACGRGDELIFKHAKEKRIKPRLVRLLHSSLVGLFRFYGNLKKLAHKKGLAPTQGTWWPPRSRTPLFLASEQAIRAMSEHTRPFPALWVRLGRSMWWWVDSRLGLWRRGESGRHSISGQGPLCPSLIVGIADMAQLQQHQEHEERALFSAAAAAAGREEEEHQQPTRTPRQHDASSGPTHHRGSHRHQVRTRVCPQSAMAGRGFVSVSSWGARRVNGPRSAIAS